MGVYIKGMEMPTSCTVCPFENYGDCYGGKAKAIMDIDDYVSAGKRHPRCPLIPVPPHGRLIDADAFFDDLLFPSKQFEQGMRELIGDAPTIIEAEETNKEAANDQNNS